MSDRNMCYEDKLEKVNYSETAATTLDTHEGNSENICVKQRGEGGGCKSIQERTQETARSKAGMHLAFLRNSKEAVAGAKGRSKE